jgi:hypothetical protein
MDSSGSVGNSCAQHPTCCAFVVAPDDKIYSCLCVPEDSAECEGMRANPETYPPTSKCPPS